VIVNQDQWLIEMLPLALAAALVLACTVTDVYQRRIPNCLTLPAIVIGLILGIMGNGWGGFLSSLLGLVIGFGLLFFPYYLGGMGAGDVKLMAALGALLGFPAILSIFLYTAIAGGILALWTVIRRRTTKAALANTVTLLINRRLGALIMRKDRLSSAFKSIGTIPYGVAMAGGTLAYLIWGGI
jgi:prepilin peptidase CpaA